jgi:hypothetical protein
MRRHDGTQFVVAFLTNIFLRKSEVLKRWVVCEREPGAGLWSRSLRE